jgi:tetratricopeptide (TPR) repeat protein
MLLRALEESLLPIVFVNGDFSYDPDYDAAVRNYRRAGKTIFTGRLSDELLAGAYAAARTHVLPSWYELPGLVSMEAAYYGKNVVVTDYGTARDYLGDDAFYCRPDDADSIANAIMAAYYAPLREGARRRVENLTWKRAAEEYLHYYEQVLAECGRAVQPEAQGERPVLGGTIAHPALSQVAPLSDAIRNASESVRSIPQAIPPAAADIRRQEQAADLCVRANGVAREGKHEEALRIFTEASQLAPDLARAHRGRGVILLLLQRYAEAEAAFEKALVVDPKDFSSKTGLGTVHWEQGQREKAFHLYQEVLRQSPSDGTAMLYFTNAAYALNRLPQLQQALEAFLRHDPDNADMNFCLAGCLFKQGKLDDAERVNKHVLRILPRYPSALELKELIEKKRAEMPPDAPLSDRLEIEQIRNVRLFSSVERAQQFFAVEELHRARKYDEALSELDKVERELGLNPYESAFARILRGESLTCKGSFVQAEQLFTAAEGNADLKYRAVSGKGVIAAAQDHWDEAGRLFQQSLDLHPNFDVALAGLGIVAQQRGDTERAWEYFHRALVANPENKRAIFGVMQLGYPLRRLDAIDSALSRYLEMNPADLSMLYSLAGCRYAQGKFSDAERELEKILVFEPSHELAGELMATIRGERGTARQHA